MDFASILGGASALLPVGEALARAGLPYLGTVLGMALPPPLDVIAPPAFAMVVKALLPGVDPTSPTAPQAVITAIQTDPDVTSKLQTIEDSHKAAAERAIELARLDNEDRADARQSNDKLAELAGPLKYMAAMFTAAVFVTCIFLIALPALVPAIANNQILMQYILSWQETFKYLLIACASYWVGSSMGSHQKSQQIERLSSGPAVIAQPGSRVSGPITKR